MKSLYRLAAAGLAFWSVLAAAQQKPAPADPADPAFAVSSPRYVSVFEGYRPLQSSPDEPDQGWIAANDVVGELGGHAGHLRGTAPEAALGQDSASKPPRRAQPHQH